MKPSQHVQKRKLTAPEQREREPVAFVAFLARRHNNSGGLGCGVIALIIILLVIFQRIWLRDILRIRRIMVNDSIHPRAQGPWFSLVGLIKPDRSRL